MKKILFLLMFPVLCFGQYTSIPDSIFEQRLIDWGYDTIQDGQVLTLSIVNIDSLTFNVPTFWTVPMTNHQIKDFNIELIMDKGELYEFEWVREY